jgi:hypothetical protein
VDESALLLVGLHNLFIIILVLLIEWPAGE